MRLEIYYNLLNRRAVSQVNMMFPTRDVYNLFSRIFTDPWKQQAGSDSGTEYSEHDGDQRSEDAFNFLRAFGAGCSDVAEVVARHDREKRAMKIKTVCEWREQVVEDENWFFGLDCESREVGDGCLGEQSGDEEGKE